MNRIGETGFKSVPLAQNWIHFFSVVNHFPKRLSRLDATAVRFFAKYGKSALGKGSFRGPDQN